MKNSLRILLKGFYDFILRLYHKKFLIMEMAKRDIKTQHVGSLLGFCWTFLNPLAMIFVLWVVFSLGFRVVPTNNVPFVIWLTAGMSIWSTFVEIISHSTGVISGNPHLVKKVVFPLSILPVTKLVSSFITHSVFLLLLVLLILLYGLPFSLYWFQIFYYFGALCVLALGLSWMLSSINVFVKDTSQIVNVLLQFGFWGTPVFWDINIMPQKVQFLLKLNPMFYIVQGYRESFIYFVPFWEHPIMTLYFWFVAIFVFMAGALIFRRLNPHFADVL